MCVGSVSGLLRILIAIFREVRDSYPDVTAALLHRYQTVTPELTQVLTHLVMVAVKQT